MSEEKKDVRLDDSQLIGEQTVRFVNVVAPYMTVQQNISDLLDKKSLDFLKGLHFFRLCSCTTEKVDNMSVYLQEQFSKLFTAIYPLNRPVVFGIVSRKGRSSLVIGFEAASDKGIVSQLMNGLLSGIELEDYSYDFGSGTDQPVRTGYISTVPVTRIDNEKQTIDLSTLMRCLNGKEYTVFVFAKPITEKIIHGKYTDLLEIRDICSSICKRNVMYQKNRGNSSSDSESVTRKGILQEVFNQALRDRKFDGKSLVDSLVDGGISSESSSTVTTEGTTEGTSFDVQNGLALELTEYCSKAIERMKYGLNIGMWDMTVAYSAPDEMSMNVLQSCLSGELAKPVTDSLPLRRFSCDDEIGNCIQLPIIADHNPLLVPVTSRELGLICTPPSNIAPDFELREGKIYPLIPSTGAITVGSVCDGSKVLLDMPFGLSEKDLNKHTFVCGITGSGKTNTVKTILRRAGKPFMVIECAKKEYRNLRIEDPDVDCEDAKHNADIVTYTLGKPEIHCLQINPFFVQRGISLQTHIDFLKDLFNASFSFYGPMPYILERCLYNIYRKKGWNVTLGYHPKLVNLKKGIDVFDANYMADRYNIYSCKYLFPTMQDLKNEVKHYIDTEMKYDSEVGGNIKTAMNARLESLCVGAKGFMFNTNNMPDMAAMLNEKVVFELEGLADDSDKAFCVGLFVIMINEYRQVFKEEHLRDDVGLQHLLVIEEAHRLLKNIDTERSSENLGNPKGKAVEHFTNMIAEMRSYGQGVIIAEQIPGKLAPDVIKNSSNKLVHRVVSSDDQALVASTIGMKEDEAVYLGNLKTGHALCHKEGMSLPVHVLADFVEDNIVSDHDLLPNDMEDIFKAINIQMVSENLSDILDKWALRLLNSILACSTECIVSDIKKTKDNLDRELRVGQVELLPVRNHYEMLGDVIASRLLPLLCMGVYSFGDLPDNELCKSITELCKKGLPTNVDSIHKQLEKRYNRKPQNHCALVISELIKSRSIQNVDYEGTIQEYFVDCVPEKVRKEIIDKCMGGKCVN